MADPSLNDASKAGPEADGGKAAGAESPDPAEAARKLAAQAAELAELAAFYLRTRLDLVSLSLRRALLYTGLLLAAALATAVFLVAACLLLLAGVAGGLAEATGRDWLGNLLAGGGVLALAAAGLSGLCWRWQAAARRASFEKYQRLRPQRHGQGENHGKTQRQPAQGS